MTLEISPVLAGTYDTPNYVATNNVAATQADDTSAIDSRRYTKFDHSATEAGSTTSFSFSDFIDMINPLQHIPVVSSVYREVTGDTINPISRVVGDILYGGAVGVASAVIGGVGATGDAIVESQTGKDSTGTVVSALFGDDQPASPVPTTQLAQASSPTPSSAPTNIPQAATQKSTQTAARINARAKLQAAATVAATSSATAASMPSFGPPPNLSLGGTAGNSSAAQMASAMSGASLPGGSSSANPSTSILPLNATKSFALDPNKLPYGGAMAPALQGTGMAVSLANSAPGLQMNHTVYTGRLMNGVRPSPLAAATSAPPGSATTDTPPAYISTATSDALPSSLMDDITAMRAINKYRNTANQSTPTGTGVDVVN